MEDLTSLLSKRPNQTMQQTIHSTGKREASSKNQVTRSREQLQATLPRVHYSAHPHPKPQISDSFRCSRHTIEVTRFFLWLHSSDMKQGQTKGLSLGRRTHNPPRLVPGEAPSHTEASSCSGSSSEVQATPHKHTNTRATQANRNQGKDFTVTRRMNSSFCIPTNDSQVLPFCG